MADYLPLFRPGATVTFNVTADVTGGQPGEVGSAEWAVKPAAADSTTVVGVAGHDAAVGDKVTVEVGRVIHEFTASGAVARGDKLAVAAGGKVAKAVPGGLWLALNSVSDGGLVAGLQL